MGILAGFASAQDFADVLKRELSVTDRIIVDVADLRAQNFRVNPLQQGRKGLFYP